MTKKSPLNWANNLESIQLCCKSRELREKAGHDLLWLVGVTACVLDALE